MEEPTPIRPIPETGEPRHCPDCGARVADMASSCLICGAALDSEEEAPEEDVETGFQIPWRGLIAGVSAALVFLVAVAWLARAQIAGLSGTPTPTLAPTLTRRPTNTATPTGIPSPTPTFTPVPPRVHQVQTGETCSSVATAYGIALDVLVALNPEKCGVGGIIRPLDLLLVPAATMTPGPTPTLGPGTPSPTPECPILHIVQAGETGLIIAEKYGVSFDLVVTANPQVDFEALPVNQVLQIPCSELPPTATPTVDPNASPTPIPKYRAPDLLNPPDGATVMGELVPLQWTAVSLLQENELYAVRLRRLDEDQQVASIFTKTTLVRLGEEYAPSPDDPVREFTWQVTVVRDLGSGISGQTRYAAASHTSERRNFRWLLTTVEVTPSNTPAR